MPPIAGASPNRRAVTSERRARNHHPAVDGEAIQSAPCGFPGGAKRSTPHCARSNPRRAAGQRRGSPLGHQLPHEPQPAGADRGAKGHLVLPRRCGAASSPARFAHATQQHEHRGGEHERGHVALLGADHHGAAAAVVTAGPAAGRDPAPSAAAAPRRPAPPAHPARGGRPSPRVAVRAVVSSGTQSRESCGKLKPRPATPTTTIGLSVELSVVPTTSGFDPNPRTHRSSLTTTGGRPRIGRGQRSAPLQGDAHQGEDVPRTSRPVHAGRDAGGGHRRLARAVRRGGREGPPRLLQRGKRVQGQARSGGPPAVKRSDRHQPVGIRERDGPEGHRVQDSEACRRGANTDREGNARR